MKTLIIVRFYHRGGWQVFEEYGVTMNDVAVRKAYELSAPFGDAEIRVVQVTDKMDNWEDGILMELMEVSRTELKSHFERFPENGSHLS